MDRERHEQVRRAFDECSELAPEDRRARLREICGQDQELHEAVEKLLKLDEGLVSVIKPVQVTPASPDESLPSRIGEFTIVQKLGAGGMGIVYLARQEQPRRQVAVKVLRQGSMSADLLRRFELEAQVLGQLQHPGIAHIYQAGTTDEGQSYFAMEYVDGIPLESYVRDEKLGTRGSLELLATICDAVHHAHQKGVIHRDLKPGNILVTREGQAKILDFGVARATDADVQTMSLQTDVGQLVGTIPYMSPEQVSGSSTDLDIRSDVYALGVLCFEMLSGRLPHAVKGQSIPEAARMIREDEPDRLSSLNPVFRGDVETIVAKALEKEPARRYESAADLAADIRRYLHDEPITARPASTTYQLKKFAKRNRALVGGAVATFAAVVVGLVVSLGLYLDAEQARRAERVEADRANAINDFLLQDMLAAPDPWSDRGKDVTVAEVLEGAASRIEGRFSDQPGVESQVRSTLAATYASLGLYADAVAQYRRSFELSGDFDQDDSDEVAASFVAFADALQKNAELEEAREVCMQALDMIERMHGREHPLFAKSLTTLGSIEQGSSNFEAGKEAYQEAVAILERTAPEDRESLATTLSDWGGLLYYATEYSEAFDKNQQALEITRDIYGERSPQSAIIMNDIAAIYTDTDSLARAIETYREVLDILHESLGPGHPQALVSSMSLGNTLRAAGSRDEAETLIHEAYETGRSTLGEDHPQVLMALNNVAYLSFDARDFEAARPLYVKLVDAADRVLGTTHEETLRYRNNLAWVERNLGNVEDAEARFRENFDAYQERYGFTNLNTLSAGHALALLLRDGERYDEAVEIYQSIIGGCRNLREECGYRWGRYLFELGQVYMTIESYPEAAATLGEGWQACVDTWGADDWRSSQVEHELGYAMARSGDDQGADRLLDSYRRLRESERVGPDYKQNIYDRLKEGLELLGRDDQLATVTTP